MTALLLLQVLALLACILHVCPAGSSESEICVVSIDVNQGAIVYSDANHSTFSEDIAHSVDELNAETVIVLFTINASESRLYEVSKTNLCYYSSPELIDFMTFNALKLVARTQQIPLNVRTFTTCGGESWENLLSEAFALDKEDGFVRSLQASNQTYYGAVSSSGLLVFVSLGLTSLFAVFVVLLPIVDASASRNRIVQRHSRPGALSRVLAKMNSLNVASFALYVGYVIFCTISYYINLDGMSALLASQYSISPFTSNAVFLFMTVCSSFLGGLFCKRNLRGCYCSIRISTACNIALTTAALYHFVFVLLVLVEDFTTAFSSLLILATIVMCIYTLFPAAYQYYTVAKATKQYCTLWFLLALSNVVPSLYIVTVIGAKELFNAGYVYIATELWLAVVLFMTTLTWIFAFSMLTSAFKRKCGIPREHGRSENSTQKGTSDDPEKALVTVSTVPACSGCATEPFFPPTAMMDLKESRGPRVV